MLNEEVLAASGAHAGRHAVVAEDAPRYSDAAGVEHHPQITDFVPRKYRTIGMLVTGGAATVAVLGALHYFAPLVAMAAGLPSLRPLDISAPGSIAAWVGAVVLFIAAVACLVVYSLRRHRIDDFRGRYRVWRSASVVCLVLSVNCVAGLHHVLAHSLSHLVGWTALRDGAVWWLAVAGVPMAWVGVRVLLDLRECRLAAAFGSAAAVLYAVAAGSYFGFVPTGDAQNASLVTGVAIVLGHWMALASVVSYARFVVLDVQGLIPVRRPATKKQTGKQTASDTSREEVVDEMKPTVLNVAEYARKRAARAEDPEDAKRWVDGSRRERESYDDDEEDSGSKMSKSDRKKMRKLKSQKRAA